ncbi:MAG: hypothetical protein GXY36_12885 [Chloroflexi bacterium]|nr:hypothetical protein [Chloroflexota bacterium]
MRRFFLTLLGVIMFAAALVILWLARGPAPKEEITTGTVQTGATLDESSEVEIAASEAPTMGAASEEVGALGAAASTSYEQRVVELEWPEKFRVGGSGSVRVRLTMLEDGSLQPVAEIADNAVRATPIMIQDRYATHDARVTATLIAPSFEVSALHSETQSLARGQDAEWRWTLQTDDAGTNVISLALNLTWQPRDGSAPISNVPVWSQAVQVQADYVIGALTVPQASILGTALGLVGLVAQIPLLEKILETLWGMIFGRRRRKKTTTTRRRK